MNFEPGQVILNFDKVREKSGNFDSYPHMHSTYGHGSLLKIDVNTPRVSMLQICVMFFTLPCKFVVAVCHDQVRLQVSQDLRCRDS